MKLVAAIKYILSCCLGGYRSVKDYILSLLIGKYLKEILPQAKFSSRDEDMQPSTTIQPVPIVILIPCKNVRRFLPSLINNLLALNYPSHLIDIGLLEGDSNDGTYDYLDHQLSQLRKKFHRVDLYKQDFHYHAPHPKRWRVKNQKTRRITIAKARNYLLHRCLTPSHQWVLWIDADVKSWPNDIIQQLLSYGKQIVVPHCVDERGRTFDLNSFKYLDDKRRNWFSYIRDGLLQPPIGYGRKYLGDFDTNKLIALDGVGATMLLVAAEAHRKGVHYPEQIYHMHIETEGLAFLARDKGYECWGSPQLKIVHPRY